MENDNIFPDNTVIDATKHVVVCGNQIEVVDGLHCGALLRRDVISVYMEGNSLRVTLMPTMLERGVNTRAIHEFNEAFDAAAKVVDEVEKKLKAESTRTSMSRTRRAIHEYAACNQWDYFATLTLSPGQWDRMSPEALQKALSEFARRVRNKMVHKQKPWKGYAYLFIPEKHKDGAIHLHGLVRMLPDELLVPYTLEEVNSGKPLPAYICDAVRSGVEVYHCSEWDKLFGYNTLTPVRDPDRVASYIAKYITKGPGCDAFPTRYFHSRGLNRAEKVAEFSGYPGSGFLVDYLDAMSRLAVTTAKGTTLQRSSYVKINGKAHLVTVTTVINSGEHPLAEVKATLTKLCAKPYERFKGETTND